jgi:hypothetical protein
MFGCGKYTQARPNKTSEDDISNYAFHNFTSFIDEWNIEVGHNIYISSPTEVMQKLDFDNHLRLSAFNTDITFAGYLDAKLVTPMKVQEQNKFVARHLTINYDLQNN